MDLSTAATATFFPGITAIWPLFSAWKKTQ